MKRIHLILLLILFFFLASFLTILLYYKIHYSTLIEKRTIPITLEISPPNLLGFDVNTTYLNFGHVPLGGSSIKHIVITNNNRYLIRGDIIIVGNITPYVGLSNQTFYLLPDEFLNLSVSVNPGNGPLGRYDGYAEIFFFKKA